MFTNLKNTFKIVSIKVAALSLLIGIAFIAYGQPTVQAQTLSGSGIATFYRPDGAIGACGVIPQYAVAVSREVFGSFPNVNNSPSCSKLLEVKGNSKTINVAIKDICMGCQGKNIDLTEKAFALLADLSKVSISVSWRVLP